MSISIIPNPESVERLGGRFVLDRGRPLTLAVRSEPAREAARLLSQDLEALGIRTATTMDGAADVVFEPAGGMAAEAHEIETSERAIVVRADDARGAFWATRSLVQLFAAERGNERVGLPGLRIADRPRFGWRGLMLDTARHFFPVEAVCRMIDLAALYKLNVLHWHLTEDQGWRIQIDRFPRLTEVAAWRGANGSRYGGFYTKDDVRRVIAYAGARGISVMPEIELPGHSLAALAAYPELSCSGGPFEVAANWGIFEDVYCAGSEKTFDFLCGVLEEVLELFPSPYVHIGGDECPKTRWKSCPRCQAAMAAHGLADAEQLQSWFISRVTHWLAERGRAPIGWDEILEGGLPSGAAVMSWRGTQGGVKAARAGHDVVMTPTSHCYLDYRQIAAADEPGAPFGTLELPTVYAYEPVPAELTESEAARVLGTQGNMWTEQMPTVDHLEYMALPRLAALAEVAWSQPARRDYADFLARLQEHSKLLDDRRVNYRRPNGAAARRDLRAAAT